jgi:hypothetical protein
MRSFFKTIMCSLILLPILCLAEQSLIGQKTPISKADNLRADITLNNLTNLEMHISLGLNKWHQTDGQSKKISTTIDFPNTPAILPGPTGFQIKDIASEKLTIKEITYFSHEDNKWQSIPNMPYTITLNTKDLTGSSLTHISLTIQKDSDKPSAPILISSNVN